MRTPCLLRPLQQLLVAMCGAIGSLGCAPDLALDGSTGEEFVAERVDEVQGDNQAGSNLGGSNLGGANLGGSNLGGANLGGANLGGSNLGGSNLGGSNLGGSNLGGSNLGGSNLGGSNLGGGNLAGTNLGGVSLSGVTLRGSNLGGSSLGGSNLKGNNLKETKLSALHLAGVNTGSNIHLLAHPIGTGAKASLLYSGEDQWFPPEAKGTNSSQRIVMGIGSTAFPRLLGEQSANATIYVALGKLPWGFANVAGGPIALDAWEAVVWGDLSYNVFILVAPRDTSWSGVAGFIKAVFRWNAPPTQSMRISGIEASALVDPTLKTTINTYTGMMNAAAKYRQGVILARDFVVGELVFITATTNSYAVQVDFSSWVMDDGPNGTGRGAILGNVQYPNPPSRYELAYFAFDNPDGSVQVHAFDPNPDDGSAAADSVRKVRDAWGAFAGGGGYSKVLGSYRPVAFRCGAYLDLFSEFAALAPPNKCDNGIGYIAGGASTISGWFRLWNSAPGTVSPMNSYMKLPLNAATDFQRLHAGPGMPRGHLPIRGETYIHLWEPGHAFNRAAGKNNRPSVRTTRGALCPGSLAGFAFDNSATGPFATQWCTIGAPSATNYKATMADVSAAGLGAFVPKRYQITANTISAAKDPQDWVFQGCATTCTVDSDTNWVTLDTQTGQTFGGRSALNNYGLTTTDSYDKFRLKITANNGSALGTAISEIFVLDG